MKAKELIKLLKSINPNAEVIVDINGGTEYYIHAEETEEQNDPDELATCEEYRLIAEPNYE
jgi:hypothetical protein